MVGKDGYASDNYEKQGAHEWVVKGLLTIDNGGVLNVATGGTLTTAGLGTISSTTRIPKVAKVALTALDTGGGVLSWANPEGATIFVVRIVLDLTTKATGACTADFGVGATGTTSNDTLMDGLDLGTATGVFDNVENQGTNGVGTVKVTSSQFITGSRASGAAAGLVGSAYIEYFLS